MTLLRNVTTTADGYTYCCETATVYYVVPDTLCNGHATGIAVGALDDVTDDVAADLASDSVPIARCVLA